MPEDYFVQQLLTTLKQPHRNLMQLGIALLQNLLKAADHEQPILFAYLLENFCTDDLCVEIDPQDGCYCLSVDEVSEELLTFCRNFLGRVYVKIDRSLSAQKVAAQVWPKLKILANDNLTLLSLLLILFLTESSFCPWLSWPEIGGILDEKSFEKIASKLKVYLQLLFSIVVDLSMSPLEKCTRIIMLMEKQKFSLEEKVVFMTYFVKYMWMRRPKKFFEQDIRMSGDLTLIFQGFYLCTIQSVFFPEVKNN